VSARLIHATWIGQHWTENLTSEIGKPAGRRGQWPSPSRPQHSCQDQPLVRSRQKRVPRHGDHTCAGLVDPCRALWPSPLKDPSSGRRRSTKGPDLLVVPMSGSPPIRVMRVLLPKMNSSA